MTTYIIRRILMTIPILIGISIISFGIMQFAPGEPTALDLDPNISPEDREEQLDEMGLNDPIPVQYVRWAGNILQGELGTSFITNRDVGSMIWERLPNTLVLMISSTIMTMIVAIPIGIISAMRQYSARDYVFTFASFIGVSIPNFWLGLMLIIFLSVQLSLFPVGGVGTLGGDFDILDRLHHLFLPALVLATADMAQMTRYTRTSMLEVKNQDYIRTARAKGFKERRVVYKHGLRNALMPLITMFGLLLPTFIGGSVVVEQIFTWPGIGHLFLESTFQRDYPVIMALTMFGAGLVVVGNLIADILYAIVDPRIEY
ncbi:ABC transporter permease [Natribacillus halophilus]|uniref:Peptide/nickel transport system permease protein n=1 Tax=Natribacillus halophilus TaxID=549003 RepID=A0A1G8S996_9BACI|nr:ABC transporter permease [Natribacillus halophilus]SDJ25802.1 peptide/nickel transport system permease protein [Natribacillus halophilus]